MATDEGRAVTAGLLSDEIVVRSRDADGKDRVDVIPARLVPATEAPAMGLEWTAGFDEVEWEIYACGGRTLRFVGSNPDTRRSVAGMYRAEAGEVVASGRDDADRVTPDGRRVGGHPIRWEFRDVDDAGARRALAMLAGWLAGRAEVVGPAAGSWRDRPPLL